MFSRLATVLAVAQLGCCGLVEIVSLDASQWGNKNLACYPATEDVTVMGFVANAGCGETGGVVDTVPESASSFVAKIQSETLSATDVLNCLKLYPSNECIPAVDTWPSQKLRFIIAEEPSVMVPLLQPGEELCNNNVTASANPPLQTAIACTEQPAANMDVQFIVSTGLAPVNWATIYLPGNLTSNMDNNMLELSEMRIFTPYDFAIEFDLPVGAKLENTTGGAPDVFLPATAAGNNALLASHRISLPSNLQDALVTIRLVHATRPAMLATFNVTTPAPTVNTPMVSTTSAAQTGELLLDCFPVNTISNESLYFVDGWAACSSACDADVVDMPLPGIERLSSMDVDVDALALCLKDYPLATCAAAINATMPMSTRFVFVSGVTTGWQAPTCTSDGWPYILPAQTVECPVTQTSVDLQIVITWDLCGEHWLRLHTDSANRPLVGNLSTETVTGYFMLASAEESIDATVKLGTAQASFTGNAEHLSNEIGAWLLNRPDLPDGASADLEIQAHTLRFPEVILKTTVLLEAAPKVTNTPDVTSEPTTAPDTPAPPGTYSLTVVRVQAGTADLETCFPSNNYVNVNNFQESVKGCVNARGHCGELNTVKHKLPYDYDAVFKSLLSSAGEINMQALLTCLSYFPEGLCVPPIHEPTMNIRIVLADAFGSGWAGLPDTATIFPPLTGATCDAGTVGYDASTKPTATCATPAPLTDLQVVIGYTPPCSSWLQFFITPTVEVDVTHKLKGILGCHSTVPHLGVKVSVVGGMLDGMDSIAFQGSCVDISKLIADQLTLTTAPAQASSSVIVELEATAAGLAPIIVSKLFPLRVAPTSAPDTAEPTSAPDTEAPTMPTTMEPTVGPDTNISNDTAEPTTPPTAEPTDAPQTNAPLTETPKNTPVPAQSLLTFLAVLSATPQKNADLAFAMSTWLTTQNVDFKSLLVGHTCSIPSVRLLAGILNEDRASDRCQVEDPRIAYYQQVVCASGECTDLVELELSLPAGVDETTLLANMNAAIATEMWQVREFFVPRTSSVEMTVLFGGGVTGSWQQTAAAVVEEYGVLLQKAGHNIVKVIMSHLCAVPKGRAVAGITKEDLLDPAVCEAVDKEFRSAGVLAVNTTDASVQGRLVVNHGQSASDPNDAALKLQVEELAKNQSSTVLKDNGVTNAVDPAARSSDAPDTAAPTTSPTAAPSSSSGSNSSMTIAIVIIVVILVLLIALGMYLSKRKSSSSYRGTARSEGHLDDIGGMEPTSDGGDIELAMQSDADMRSDV
eukprot:TRINITY_DN4106_c0_g1_i1.p1 TRINITY_DN4106_c0_g1~~TRINITY_DN4106_c0_g1_i1.p1  ORF type:complete len:1261 (+),score=269.79 TRINITY_DN4106_c0_g1_i1:78-3860(+)